MNPRPDLEQVIAERLSGHQMSPELVTAFAQMLSEWELHWWTEGQKYVRSQLREAMGS